MTLCQPPCVVCPCCASINFFRNPNVLESVSLVSIILLLLVVPKDTRVVSLDIGITPAQLETFLTALFTCLSVRVPYGPCTSHVRRIL